MGSGRKGGWEEGEGEREIQRVLGGEGEGEKEGAQESENGWARESLRDLCSFANNFVTSLKNSLRSPRWIEPLV